jgi:hypothetical protein
MKNISLSLNRILSLALLLLALCGCAYADVGLMLNEALRIGASKWTGAGHAAVYLSGVCASTPVQLRPCLPGEDGVVLTDYADFGEDRLYQWNAIPLNIYLYGVEDESERALYASPSVRWILQERYREKYLTGLCKGTCLTNPDALWRESIGATFERDIYMFRVKSTPEQDLALIEKFNRAGNVGHFSGFRNNCADFAALVVNTYFPHSAKADRVNDFLMTSPKAIAKSFTHYAMKRPELEFRVIRYSQIPGDYKTSRDNRKGTEQLYRANRWRLPLAILRPQELLIFTSSYMVTGRVNPELELHRRPVEEVIALQTEMRLARSRGDHAAEKECRQKIRAARTNALGTGEEWAGYVQTVRQYENEAIDQGYISDFESLRKVTRKTIGQRWITMDDSGGLWLNSRDGRSPKVGLSPLTMAKSSSDARTGYLLALSRVDAELRRNSKNRETLEFFRQDWQLLEQLRGQVVPVVAGSRHAESGGGSAPSGGSAQ